MRLVWMMCAAGALAGCSDSGWDSIVEVGRIAADPQPIIDVPSTATAGTPFIVNFSTEGDGCTSVDSTDTSLSDGGAILTPYDRQAIPTAPNEACPSVLALLRHWAQLTFDVPGTYTVLIRVRGGGTGSDGTITLVDYPRTVVVQ